jgi:hypothetical protein
VIEGHSAEPEVSRSDLYAIGGVFSMLDPAATELNNQTKNGAPDFVD